MDQSFLSPKEFLRARRPERFSDSVVVERPSLDRALLEFHLETLTNRSQETPFANFARRLLEREVCPNLLPQTGPTGGGDSKVDSETYPVADTLSVGWYVGVGREAASERWAFAFSAKKDWKGKVRSDVEKIAETARGYSKAFFVTNQYVPDKARASMEDALRKAHGIDVRIFDRTWILDRVFTNGHESLAIKELEIALAPQHEVRRGPLDTQREQDLEEVEHRIQLALQQGRGAFELVNDALEAADLTRGLERPRTEVEGMYARAERLAQEFGTPHQQLRSAYDRAWTAMFWFEDYDHFNELYDVAEQRAKDSRNASELELLTNLWLVLNTAVGRKALDPSTARLVKRRNTLINALKRLEKEHERPSTALQARTLRLQMRLASTLPENADPILRELRNVVRQSEGLVGYPLEPLAAIVGEMGFAFGKRAAYDDLFETVIAITSRRAGEVSAARALLSRGAQQLDADRPYEAIRTIGRALARLSTHESRRDLIRALYLCANAYERVGLLWAARGTLLVAASVATNDFWSTEAVTVGQAVCYNRLKWVELQLGRVAQTLAWHEVDRIVTGILASKGYHFDQTSRGASSFDALLGILFLRTELVELKKLLSLPAVLDELDLPMSAVALLYALGHSEEVPAELVGDGASAADVHSTFEKWRDQPAAKELPAGPVLYDGRTVILNSKILGCRISVESENASPCVELAETVLAAFEAMLSTAGTENIVAHEPVLTIFVRRNDVTEHPFSFEISEREGRPHVEIRCRSFDPHSLSLDAQAALKRKLFDLFAESIAHVVWIGREEDSKDLESFFDEGNTVQRSLDFATSFVTIGNVLGKSPKDRLSAWISSEAKVYPLKREQEWDLDHRRGLLTEEIEDSSQPTYGKGEPPEEVTKVERAKHTEMEIVSLIRTPLWKRARWSGTMFLMTQDMTNIPPIIAPIFTNFDAARQIFDNWGKELGARDGKEILRLTIIRGVNRAKPHAYRVVIGANVPNQRPKSGNANPLLFMISRVNTMEPDSDTNLQRFLQRFYACGEYSLAGAFDANDGRGPQPVSSVQIAKRELNVREAFEIGRNDPDAAGIRATDKPIIPAGKSKAPVVELLRFLRKR
jgi:hypothetical protein